MNKWVTGTNPNRQKKKEAMAAADQLVMEANNAFDKAKEKLLQAASEYAVAEKAAQLAWDNCLSLQLKETGK